MDEIELEGGWMTSPVRIGATVRRSPGHRAEYVRDLLTFLSDTGWDGAPRFLGIDEQGRDVLDYLDGHVAWKAQDQPSDIRSEQSLAAVARLVRAFHDLTAGSALAGDAEVVCHNDLSPKNTVYRDLGDGLRPVAFIDWDIAAPGRRIHDVAFICWQYLGLGEGTTDVGEAVDGLRLLCDAYGLEDRGELIETVLWWQERTWRGIEASADAGEPSGLRLREAGVVQAVNGAWRWVSQNREVLQAAVGMAV